MDTTRRATLFHSLHRQAQPLMLPNVWDGGSARLMESLGAAAIATTSAGVAWSLGYRDGNALPVAEYLARTAAIARVVALPLSVDIEGGYTNEPEALRETVARFIEQGAVGINIEDGSGAPDLLCRKIEAARSAAERCGVALYINVRTDVYSRKLAPQDQRVEEVLARARRYRDAGADGLFVLGLTDAAEIARVVAGTELLLNLAAWPGLAPAADLAALGVRRVSAGSLIPQSLWTHAAALASGFLADGRSEPLLQHAAPYADINACFPA